MHNTTLKIGQELRSDNINYRIESVLGQGSFGVTYKAKAYTIMKGKLGEELVGIKTPKAIKEFFMKDVNERDISGSITGMTEDSLSYNYAQKFKREAENLSGMNHPNIVKVIDFFSANGTYYYVMDYIEGENLNDYLKRHPMSEKEATDTILEVAKALKYMHEEKKMLHLDLKPGNIMRRACDGHIFIIDFGLSKHYNEDGIPETSTSVGLGTPGYAPIEQANSKNSKQFRATLDIYALGATFYKLLTGQTPPSADELVSDEDLIRNKLNESGVCAELVNVIFMSMNPNAKLRTQTVADFYRGILNTTKRFDKLGSVSQELSLIAGTISKNMFSSSVTTYSISPLLKYRYYLGMVINMLIGIYMLSVIISGGMYDYDWDYHYGMFEQLAITFTCFASALLEYLYIHGRKLSFQLLLTSNSLFWFFTILLNSMDPKTGISYFGIGFLVFLILTLITSLFNYYINRLGLVKRDTKEGQPLPVANNIQGHRDAVYLSMIVALIVFIALIWGAIKSGHGISTAEEVDLGLSVKWAGYNIGATEPQDTGSVFNRNTILTEAELLVYKKKGWRLPTNAECLELKEKCEWERVNYRGVSGWTIKGPNGKSIFFPMRSAKVEWENDDGYYLMANNECMLIYGFQGAFIGEYSNDMVFMRLVKDK